MGWGRRKLDNAMAGTLPPIRPPINTTIHNHGVSWPAIIAVGFVCFLLSLPVLWWILVYLFTTMGGTEKEAAFWVVIILVLFLVGWVVKEIVVAVSERLLDSFYSYRLEVQKEITRREELRLAAVQSQVEPGRMNEADYEFAKVILAVMMTAYDWLAQNGYDKFPARWRPWSMRSALEAGERIGIKLTQERANAVSVWLHDKGVITSPDGGQITKKYPDLASVRAMLDREFGKPIVVVSLALRDNRGYDIIKQAN